MFAVNMEVFLKCSYLQCLVVSLTLVISMVSTVEPDIPCDDCWRFSCEDANGFTHDDGSSWFPDECHQCTCNRGRATCNKFEVACPARPLSYCTEVPGPCCPKWNCTVARGCTEGGVYHELFSTWQRSPCITHVCTSAGVLKITKDCPPQPHANCEKVVIEGECCPEWKCGIGCTNDDGSYRELYSSWQTDPCIVHICTHVGVLNVTRQCKPKPHHNCQEINVRGECCPNWKCGPDCTLVRCAGPPSGNCFPYRPPLACCNEWNCSGCVDERGVQHEVGSQWTKDPCTTSLCTEAGIKDVRKYCPPLPPRPGCSPHTPRGECCPVWNCSGCVDERDVEHEVGSRWTKDPCTTSLCTEAGIKDVRKYCSPLPPRPGCSLHTPRGECCPVWNCSGCVDERGVGHEVGSRWTKDPCTTSLCTEAGIKDVRKYCPPLPPRPGCSPHTPRGECCPVWNCSGCVDERDVEHEVGSRWTKDPCTTSLCTEAGIKDARKYCSPLPPRPGCSLHTPRGECCPVWNCSGCVDERGVEHEVGSRWTKDPCTTSLCTEAGIKDVRKYCSPLPPRPGCSLHTPRGECCPVWNCSGCVDERGVEHEVGSRWTKDPCTISLCTEAGIKDVRKYCSPLPPRPGCSPYTPRGECCPVWNCRDPIADFSGCVDERGVEHEVESHWTKDPCTTSLCTEAGIKDVRKYCPPLPPRPGCSPHTPRGECCPVWNCSRTLNGCVDSAGVSHELSSHWSTDDPCTTLLCTTDGIKRIFNHCESRPPPYPSCFLYTPPGECCTSWNCSGCVDSSGAYHVLYDTWSLDPCTRLLCTTGGIGKMKAECVLGDPPHISCRRHTPAGECCPKWKCSTSLYKR
ncbi:kielin/chordin-like protein isoform X2 [Procambarus clarkii]|uniref:kielin/chordin-like protein isoform X2 n=1 Tax=Procambarus clarkii TaxID=6728 RepID=UPI003742E95F